MTATNLDYLKVCQSRIQDLSRFVSLPVDTETDIRNVHGSQDKYFLDSIKGQIEHYRAAEKDLTSKLTKEEKAELKASAPRVLTAAEQEALVKQLDENKDRASH